MAKMSDGKEVEQTSTKNVLLAKVIACMDTDQMNRRPYPDYNDCFMFDSFPKM